MLGEEFMWVLSLALLFFLFSGMRVFYSLMAVGIIGTTLILTPAQPVSLGRELWSSINSYSLTAIPLYILMAELLMVSGVTQDAFRSVGRLLGFLPGGIAYANIAGSAIFAAISGSSVANAATLGSVAGPTMVELGYNKRLTFGTIAAGGAMGVLMPPSAAMIIYGSLTGVSISELFIAGVIPAFMLAGLFFVTIMIWTIADTKAVPETTAISHATDYVSAAKSLLPLFALIGAILGGIYAGIFTPTEAAVSAPFWLASLRSFGESWTGRGSKPPV